MSKATEAHLGMVLIECPRCGGTGEVPLVDFPAVTRPGIGRKLLQRVDAFVCLACPTCSGGGSLLARHVKLSDQFPRKDSKRKRIVLGQPEVG